MRSPKRIDASPTLYHILLPKIIQRILLKKFIEKDMSVAIPFLRKNKYLANKSGVDRLIID